MSNEKQALTIANQSSVTPWASRQEVREMEERLKTMLPGASKLNSMELFGLAQAAIAHNLDPFNGEIWCIPGKGLMAGIKGHRRAAHRQINEEANGNGNYYVEFFLIPTDEMVSLKIPPKSLAFRCRLHDSQTTRAYVENVERMLKAGMPWEIVSKIMGDQPYTEGIGYYIDGESTKMTPVQCSQKRAEADALKRRFDLPFTMVIGVNGDADIVDAEFTVSNPEQDPAEVQAKMQASSAALRGDQSDIDLGPQWTEPPELPSDGKPLPTNLAEAYRQGAQDGAAVPAIVPPAQRTADESRVKPATLRYQPFVSWCNEWVKDARAAKYAKEEGGQANMYHILKRVSKLEFAEVTEANVEQVKAALMKYVEGA